MYYRGANAALVLYDITNASTFEDVRGWLEGPHDLFHFHYWLTCSNLELKKNCPPELIIYVVGSKADLHRHRQVTSDFARLSLHNWFPPPRPATPPPPPPPSTLSYIRPRFTSFPGLRSPPVSPPVSSPPTDTLPYLDPPSRGSGLNRSKSAAPPRSRNPAPSSLVRSNTTNTPSRFGSHFGMQAGGYKELHDSSSNSIEEEEEEEEGHHEEQEWGLTKDMELFEVSAKDDLGGSSNSSKDFDYPYSSLGAGIHSLFDHLITAIIQRKDVIEKENELKKRDSVFLSSVATPTWSAQAEEEEARQKAKNSTNGWSCC